jgi:cytochrome c peroxidase
MVLPLIFVASLMAFEWAGHYASADITDSLRFRIPANFPQPAINLSSNPVTPAGFALGKALFYDDALSADRTTSCGSCHQASAAFANLGSAVSTGVNRCKGTRNAPPLFNMAWQKAYMWDGRLNNMQTVPVNAITNACEMGTTMAAVVSTVKQSPAYAPMFTAAFGNADMSEDKILRALSQFTVMLVSANSKYDRVMRHDANATFSPDEQAGYTFFKRKCSTCHSEPLFTDLSYRNNGLEMIAKDSGRDSATHNTADVGKFRVPSLRNIEITGPYMHDGRFYSLKEVLQHYSSGMQNHANLDPVLKQSGKPGIAFTAVEQRQVIAFLKTLTDVDFINDRRFNNH